MKEKFIFKQRNTIGNDIVLDIVFFNFHKPKNFILSTTYLLNL